MNARTFFLFVSPLMLLGVLLGIALRPSFSGGLFWDDGARDEVQGIIDRHYVEQLTPEQEQQLFDEAMRAYVGTLDPFSRYFTAEEKRDLDEETRGSFAGVGVQIRSISAGLLVTAVYTDGPADEAGLEPGDIVTAVDGNEIAGQDLSDTILLIKGPVDTEVRLDVVRDERPPEPYLVVRGIVGLDTVPSVRLLDGTPKIGYVRVEQFSETTPEDVRKGLERLTDEGAESFVLDLRQNLGGVVDAAVRLAGLFLPAETTVCVTRERSRQRTYTIAKEPGSDGSAPFRQPLMVLVDDGSASASEILAGALQDHGRAVLVGERTYGKFLVQTLVDLDANDALVRLTTARYETPRGRSGQRLPDGTRGGIMPDLRVDLVGDDRRAVMEAFVRQSGPRWRVLDATPPQADGSDTQLRAAVELLHGGAPPAEPLRPAPEERG